MAVQFLPDVFYRPSDDALRSIGTESTLAQWRCYGTGPVFHKLNAGRSSRILYHGADLLEWLAEKRVAGAAEAA